MILRSRSASPARAIVAVMAAALVPVIAGCDAGANAPTQQWHQPTPGASAVVDKVIRINNLFVLGPAPVGRLGPGASAGVFLALSNSGAPDRLVSISAPDAAQSVRLPAGGVSMGSQKTVLLTGPQPKVLLEGLTRSLRGGQFVRMTLQFARAGQVTLNVPVMPRASDYATYSPPPPSSAASPSGTATTAGKNKKKRGTNAATPTPSPAAASPTPSASPTA